MTAARFDGIVGERGFVWMVSETRWGLWGIFDSINGGGSLSIVVALHLTFYIE